MAEGSSGASVVILNLSTRGTGRRTMARRSCWPFNCGLDNVKAEEEDEAEEEEEEEEEEEGGMTPRRRRRELEQVSMADIVAGVGRREFF